MVADVSIIFKDCYYFAGILLHIVLFTVSFQMAIDVFITCKECCYFPGIYKGYSHWSETKLVVTSMLFV